MSQPVKLGLGLIVGVVALVVVLNILGLLMHYLIPLAILGGIGLVVYGLVSRNSLPGGRRYLP